MIKLTVVFKVLWKNYFLLCICITELAPSTFSNLFKFENRSLINFIL